MNLKNALPAAVAVLFLIAIGFQTSDALKRSGTWTRRTPDPKHAADPYVFLENELTARAGPVGPPGRDPFAFGSAPALVLTRDPKTQRVVEVPRPRPRPILTAIVADEDPRALIRYEDRNYSVKTGDLFAEFRVISVNSEQVVLDGGGQRLVLRRPTKGD